MHLPEFQYQESAHRTFCFAVFLSLNKFVTAGHTFSQKLHIPFTLHFGSITRELCFWYSDPTVFRMLDIRGGFGRKVGTVLGWAPRTVLGKSVWPPGGGTSVGWTPIPSYRQWSLSSFNATAGTG